jgi:glutamate--cysteine ligase
MAAALDAAHRSRDYSGRGRRTPCWPTPRKPRRRVLQSMAGCDNSFVRFVRERSLATRHAAGPALVLRAAGFLALSRSRWPTSAPSRPADVLSFEAYREQYVSADPGPAMPAAPGLG